MAPVVHPGRLLKREMVARKLSANRLSLDIGVPPAGSPTSSTAAARSRPIPQCGSAVISATARSSGWICRVNMTSAGRAGEGRRDRQTRPAGGCGLSRGGRCALEPIRFPDNVPVTFQRSEPRQSQPVSAGRGHGLKTKSHHQHARAIPQAGLARPVAHRRPRGLSVLPAVPARRVRAELRPADHHHRRRERHRQIDAARRDRRAGRL